MDTTRPIAYRGLALNDALPGGGHANIAGIAIEKADYSAVPGFGYTEKRSQQDGYDAGDVYLGMRNIDLDGTIYGLTRAELFDRLANLRAAFTPTGAYAEDPASYGYLPLTFEEVTGRTDDFPAGYIEKQMNVRAKSTPHFLVTRDSIGGNNDGGLAIPWKVSLEARDPRIYGQVPIIQSPVDAATSGVFDFHNRGSYPAPILIDLYINGSGSYDFTFSGFGSVLKLTMPAGNGERILHYNGYERYTYYEKDGLNTLRMDLQQLLAQTPHPQVPPGEHSATWSATSAVSGNSTVTFREAWA